jgi:hypothetical protein
MSIHTYITPADRRRHQLPLTRPLSPHGLVLLSHRFPAPLLFALATPRRICVHLAGPANTFLCPLLRAGYTLTRVGPMARTVVRQVHGHADAVQTLAALATLVAQHFSHRTRRWPATLDPAHLSLAFSCQLSVTRPNRAQP